MRTDRLIERHPLAVTWTHFPLHPEIPQEGLELSELFAGREADLDAMRTRLEALMAEAGLPYGDRTRTYNSRLAQELAAWAVEQNDAADDDRDPSSAATPPIHDALFRAYFVDDRNLADPEVLVSVAESVGLPGDGARTVLDERRFRDAVDRDWERSRRLGIRGVPAYVAGRYLVLGAQPYEVLGELVTRVVQEQR